MHRARPFRFALFTALATTSLGIALPATAQLASALLPSSRSAEVGNTVTVFSTVINAGTETATGCQIDQLSALPLNVGYQTTDPATNSTTGTANTPVDILAGQSQSFVLSVTPTAVIDSTEVEFAFTCTSGDSAGTIAGVNTLLLSASDTPVADVVALSATTQNTGVLSHESSAGAFALATINLGAADDVTVAADTGATALPVTLSICETNPDGNCQSSPASTVSTSIAAGGTPTFSVFSSASGAIANDPAVNRVFVRFTDSNSIVRGGTSVAIENQENQENEENEESQPAEGVPMLAENSLAVLSQGLSLLFLEANDPNAPNPGVPGIQDINLVVPCEQTGQLVAVGTFTTDQMTGSSTLDANLNYQDCDGVNGSIDMLVVTSFNELGGAFEVNQTGSYSSPECAAVTLVDVQTSATVNPENDNQDDLGLSELTTTGSINGVCEGQSFDCTLDGVDLSDPDALANSCDL